MANDRKDKNFTKTIVTKLGERAHFLCSNPRCRKMTTGPHSMDGKSLRTGDAAHIYSARAKNARYNPDLTDEQVKNIKNGIWLCRECHKKVDHDEKEFPASLLFNWKKTHEEFVKALRSSPISGTLRLIQPTIEEELIAKDILDFLDDRRALHNDFQMEVPSHVFMSLQETRKELLRRKRKLDQSFLSKEIDKMLKAIRTFLDTIYDIDINQMGYNHNDRDWMKFENSLSILRKVIGVVALTISEKYKLRIGYELSKIIPEE